MDKATERAMIEEIKKAGGSSLERVVRRRRDLWNKCHECGRIIPYADFESGKALNRMITPDSEVSYESWEILCRDHYKPSNRELADRTLNPSVDTK